jgi:hypothetical protein
VYEEAPASALAPVCICMIIPLNVSHALIAVECLF